ncbi:MAG: hypothetical protein RLT05_10445 [Bauldia litoralis]
MTETPSSDTGPRASASRTPVQPPRAHPAPAPLAPADPDHPQWKRRRRRNSTLLILGIGLCCGATGAGMAGVSNAVLTNALYAGVLLAGMGAGLYTWTALDRLRPAP